MSVNLDAYEQWLQEEGYQPSTIKATLRHTRVLADNPTADPGYRLPIAKRYLRFVAATRREPLGKAFTKRLKARGIEPASVHPRQGARVKDVLPRHRFVELRARLRQLGRGGDETALLLVAYMQSPLRVGEFLRLRPKQIDELSIVDKISRDWILDRDLKPRTPIYKLLCDTEKCTYVRLRRKLQEVAEELRINVDLDTLYKSFHAMQEAA